MEEPYLNFLLTSPAEYDNNKWARYNTRKYINAVESQADAQRAVDKEGKKGWWGLSKEEGKLVRNGYYGGFKEDYHHKDEYKYSKLRGKLD